MDTLEKPRISRLTAIITQLQSRRLVTANYLAEHYQVSIRTIYRDIQTLINSGIPIITEEGKGYTLMDGYQLPPVLFSEQEANALITAERLVQQNKDQSLSENYSSAMTKIKSVLKRSQKGKADLLTDRVYIGEKPIQKSSGFLIEIQSAITNFRFVKITYLSTDSKLTQRTIEPFGLYSTQGNWLLIAYCQLRKDFRVFRIDFIQKLTTMNETFEPHQLTMEEYFFNYVQKKRTTPDIPLS
ncbi:MAG: YafY family protein [Cytophagales bacterium]|nr:YafY family protein [Cytophagales bacterium]